MITIGIASIPSRIEMLEKVLDSLVGQADQIFLGLNYGDAAPPKYLSKYPNVCWWHNSSNLGDKEKFAMINSTDGVYLACDDDLLYPIGYVQKMVDGVNEYNGLVSLHGRTYLKPIKDFRQWAGNYRCLNTVSEDVKVNLIGTGCCAFHMDRLRVLISDFKTMNMADLWLSKLATEQGVPMMVLAHQRSYLIYLNPKETIWNQTKDFSEHTRILQSFIK